MDNNIKAEGVENIEARSQDQESDNKNHDIDPKDLEIEKLKNDLSIANDKFIRAVADHQNFTRRTEKDLQEANKYAITKFARDLIEVLENLHRAVAYIPSDISDQNEVMKNFTQGVQMTQTILEGVFEKNGIARIYPMDMQFDHNYHQAIGYIENQDKDPNTVVQVVRAGYVIKDRLLQPALVMLSKKAG